MKLEPNSFFSDKGITTPSTNARAIRVNNIMQYIRESPGTTAYEISKKLKYSYSDVARIVRDLEYTQIVIVKIEVLDSVVRKKLFIPEIKSGRNKNG